MMNRGSLGQKKLGHGLGAVLVVVLTLLTTVPGLAQIGIETMNYQGRLLDASGNPRSGETHCLRFRICSGSDCQIQAWPSSGYEYHVVTTESGPYTAGLFTVVLGSTNAIPSELMVNNNYLFLETGVADEATCPGTTWTTLTPRSQLRASAYAQVSRRVETWEASDNYLVNVNNNGQGGGISGRTFSSATAASGGSFSAYNPTGLTSGLVATNWSETDDATAGSFYATGSTGRTYGIRAENKSQTDQATAGYFDATGTSGWTRGVRALNHSTSNGAVAGLFEALGESGATMGIEAFNNSTTDNATAGFFHARGTEGRTSAVWAHNDSATYSATAGYFVAGANSGQTYGIRVQNNSSTANAAVAQFVNWANSGATIGVEAINISTTDDAKAGFFLADGASGETYGLFTRNDSTDSESVAGYFHASGGVGVHARSDSENSIEAYSSATERTFYVNNDGNVWADGAFFAPSADFAEMWPSEEIPEPGDVLIINADGFLVSSSFAYDTHVVGVYSSQPAFVGGSDEAMQNSGKIPLAVVGIVLVKACDNGGPILPGDLLVTSDTPGHVMKAEPNPPVGTVVGKAMGALESGADLIQMLVSLQ